MCVCMGYRYEKHKLFVLKVRMRGTPIVNDDIHSPYRIESSGWKTDREREREQSVGAFMLRLLRQFNVPPSFFFVHPTASSSFSSVFPPTLLRSYDIFDSKHLGWRSLTTQKVCWGFAVFSPIFLPGFPCMFTSIIEPEPFVKAHLLKPVGPSFRGLYKHAHTHTHTRTEKIYECVSSVRL